MAGEPGAKLRLALHGLQKEQPERPHYPGRPLEDGRDRVAAQTGDDRHLDLTRLQGFQPLPLPAGADALPRPGQRSGFALAGDDSMAALSKGQAELAVAATDVGHRQAGGDGVGDRAQPRRKPPD